MRFHQHGQQISCQKCAYETGYQTEPTLNSDQIPTHGQQKMVAGCVRNAGLVKKVQKCF